MLQDKEAFGTRGSTLSVEVQRGVERFEEAWQRGERPTLEDYLPPSGAERHVALVELVHVDLERRLEAGESVRVEDYLQRYPGLATEAALVELVYTEYAARSARESDVTVAEYFERFPQYRAQLAERLARNRDRLRSGRSVPVPVSEEQPRFPVRLNCPHCQNPIALGPEAARDEVVCPSCGSTFRLDRHQTVSWKPEKLPWLGKFELLETVGHGAFGTMYRARDTELDRIVAVKVPRSGAFSSKEDEDRFIREARSTAQLHHVGIIPVYEVGRADSFPYIVSEYVSGITLADALTGRRFSFHESAEIIAQVAEALAHSHAQGVIHRDLKPSNIMLEIAKGGDSSVEIRRRASPLQDKPSKAIDTSTLGPAGSRLSTLEYRPRLMDFGLARREEGEVSVTLEGQVLGTPAYMSPEQARGESHRVDGRSDVYSLGVILYQLLVGEVPFRGNMRMLLHQVLHDDPRAPRRLNDRIPRDLETITLQCLAKDPNRRFATASALAADLRRWLADEPIQARPVGRWERIRLRIKRNPRAALLSALVAVLLLTTLVASTTAAFVFHAAQAREQRAKEALTEAIETWMTGVSQAVKYYPGLQKVRQRVLSMAVQEYESIAAENRSDLALQSLYGKALVELGEVSATLGQRDEAERAYRLAESFFAEFSQLAGQDPGSRRHHAVTQAKLANLFRDTSRFVEAEALYRTALTELRSILSQDPTSLDCRDALAATLVNQGLAFCAQNRHDETLSSLQNAIAEYTTLEKAGPDNPGYRFGLATAKTSLAQTLGVSGRCTEAASVLEEAIRVLDWLVGKYPDDPRYRENRAASRVGLANSLRALGQDAAQIAAYEAALADFDTLRGALPDVPYFQEQFAVTCTNLSHVLHELGRNQEAKGRLEAALAVLRDLQQQDPKLQYHYHFALSLLARGQVLSGLGLDTEAEGDFRSATEILETLIGRQADEGWRCDLAITRSNWARLLHKLERFDDAEAMFRAAIQDFEVLSEHVRRMPAVKDCTAWSYDYFGDLLFDAGKRQDAERAYRRALQAWEAAQQTAGSPAYQHHLAWFLANCPVRSLRDPQRAVDLANQAKNQTPENAAYWNTLGVANYRSAQYEASLAALREAQKHRPDGNSLDWFFLAMAYGRLGDVEMSRQCYEQGTQWMTRHTPGDFRLRKIRVEAEQLIESPPNPETGPANDEP